MIFELVCIVEGTLNINDDSIEVKKNPYTIRLYKDDNDFLISISKPINANSECLPTWKTRGREHDIILPKESSYNDMLELLRHIESFGSLDNRIESIDLLNITLKWTPENEHDHFSPIREISRKTGGSRNLNTISEEWLSSTILHKNQFGDLYFPFSFFRDGKNLFNSARYQSAFCTFFMMLEYFYNEKGWGIAYDAYKRKPCLNTSLKDTLESTINFPQHHEWMTKELQKRGKSYDNGGLLFLINRFRDEFSHANDENKNRNVFNEKRFFSLAFITMMLCQFVSIKKRLLPFVSPIEKDAFLNR